jgi:carnitine 3-dehydrogenase
MLAESFYKTLGRKTVRLKKEAIGHIANRLSSALWREAVNMVAEGIADVAEIDAALVHGPGLRWSVVGAHMAYHLGGGSGGIEHYLKHLGPSQEARWASLGSPSLTPDICAKLIAGVMAEAAGRSIPELEAERDAGLMRVLAARDAPPE